MGFLDKVKEGFDKSVATVSTGSKVMIEKSKLNSSIKHLEDEIKQLEGLIGVKVFSLIAQGEASIPAEDLMGFYNEIISRRQQIESLNAKIAELDNEMNQVKGVASDVPVACPCGEINPPGSRFCSKCGRTL